MLIPRLAIGFCTWAGLLYGALAIRLIPGHWGDTICGPWGCGPELQPLVACHTFWLVLLGPPFWLVSRNWSSASLWRAVKLLGFAVVAGILAIGVWQAATWLRGHPGGYEYASQYFGRRWMFVLVTTVELPILPLALVALPLCGRLLLSRRPQDHRVGERTVPPSVVLPE